MHHRKWFRAVCVTLICGSQFSLVKADEPQLPSKVAEAKSLTSGEGTEKSGTIQRSIYLAKHAAASELAFLLGKQFVGDASVQVVAEPNANVLLIRTSSATVFDEVLKTLSQVDKPPRQIVFQVLIVELNTPKAVGPEKGTSKSGVDTSELTGSADAVRAKLASWMLAGHVTTVRRFTLTAQENQLSQLQLGEEKAIAMGLNTSIAGQVNPLFQRLPQGTIITLTPRITEARDVITTCVIEDSQFEAKDRGVELFRGDNGSIKTQGKTISTLRTTLTIPDGQSSVPSEWQVESKSNHVPSMVVISARIVDPNAPPRVPTSNPTTPAPAAAPPNTPTRTVPVPDDRKRTSRVSPSSQRGGTPAERLAAIEQSLKSRPDDLVLLKQRAQLHVEMRQWDKAITDFKTIVAAPPADPGLSVGSRTFGQLTPTSPGDYASHIELAMLLVHQRDEAGFRQCTRQMLDQFADAKHRPRQHHIARACLLMPEWLDDSKRADQFLEDGLSDSAQAARSETYGIAIQNDQGWLQLRRGQPLVARKTLEENLDRLETAERRDEVSIIQCRLLLAMALQAIGNSTRAETILKAAEEDFIRPRIESNARRFPMIPWSEWLHAELLLRQAQVQVRGKESPTEQPK
jgi:tetratricopeptide (TPR) repeat protein